MLSAMRELRGRALMTAIVACSSSAFLLIGYDNGVMGGLVNNSPFLDSFHLDAKRDAGTIGTIVAIYEIGCFLGSLASAAYADKIGRRKTILVGTLWMVVGALMQALAPSQGVLIAGRIVSGIGLGGINSAAPVIQCEMSSPKSRGRLVCVQLSTLNFGILISYWVDYGFSKVLGAPSYAWRIPIALQLIFVVALILLAMIIPETPRWLASQNRPEEALSVLARLSNKDTTDPEVLVILDEIVSTLEIERAAGTGSWMDILKNDAIKSRQRFFIACCIQFFQQAGGINGIIYYSGTIFQQSIQLSNENANLVSGVLFTWFFVASFIPHPIIDSVGRRKLLLSTIAGMTVVFAIEASLIAQLEREPTSKVYGSVAAALIFVYMTLFTIGFQAVVWLIPSEVLPLKLRAKGSSVSTAANWITNYAVVQITPLAIGNIGYKYYILFAILNACFLAPIYLFLPETAGKSLESVDALFAGDDYMSRAHQDGQSITSQREDKTAKKSAPQ